MKKNRNFIKYKIGEKIRYYRKLRGLTLKDLSRELKITSQQLQKYEKNKNRVTTERLLQISSILDLPISSFFDDITPEDTTTPDIQLTKLIYNFKRISSEKIKKLLVENSSVFAEL